MNKTFACARGDFGAVGDVDEVGMTVMAIFATELISWGYNKRLYGVSCLSEKT